MNAFHTIACCLALALPCAAQNLYQQRATRGSLIDDHTARNVGDVLSIVIQERHKVKNEDKVERSNSTTLQAQLDAYTLSSDTFNTNVLPEFDARSNREFDGQAKQEKDSTLEASMAVMIVDTMPNGNLIVAGSRMVKIDDETKTLRISGVIRQLDISATNSVSSSLVAEARVSITGEGANSRQVTKGPIGTMFETLIWAAWPF
ncbi:MAG: flagellar basal body L-ring protein FlgH [Planctomycetes bacterium]|nr:flagellar basal body L-ring protein FlgH [Planctomycetota bacterium]